MTTVDIHEAKTHLSKLIERAVRGEPVVIAKAGPSLVKVTAIHAPAEPRRLDFSPVRSRASPHVSGSAANVAGAASRHRSRRRAADALEVAWPPQ